MHIPTLGVEEEFFLADAHTGEIREDGAAIRERAAAIVEEGIDEELRTAMLEIGTAVCSDAAAARRELQARRDATVRAADDVGARVLATASHPVARARAVGFTEQARYQKIANRFGRVADEMLVCGCHVHVQVPSRDVGVAVIDRIGVWLAPLIALAANSPFWQGSDTGYDSWRTQVWSRWPTAGPTSPFHDLVSYETRADELVATGGAIDRAMLYYDARLSESFPTIEVRVADVCLEVDDAVLVAVLVRALVVTAIEQQSSQPPDWTVELRRAAAHAASRDGLSGRLVDPVDRALAPARDVLDRLVRHVAAALDQLGDADLARDGIARLLANGNAAARQRAAWRSGGSDALLGLVALRRRS